MPPPQHSVDLQHWRCYTNGVGWSPATLVVDQGECRAAEAALARGENVLLRTGQRLLNRWLVPTAAGPAEVSSTPRQG